MSGKYFADDRFIISDEVKNMSKEERKREIARLENEIKDRKRNMQKRIQLYKPVVLLKIK